MVRKPISGDSEQRERNAERSRKASELSPAGDVNEYTSRTSEGRATPSNGGPEEESAHGALIREGIDSD